MINKKNGIKCKIYFFDLFNHISGKKNILIFFGKYKVFIVLLFILYPNFTKIGDKKITLSYGIYSTVTTA